MVKADDEARKLAMFKNGYLRLLMTLIGFQRVGAQDDPDTSWIVPSTISADQLKQALDLIAKSEFSPPVFDDGKEAGDFIRRKSAGTTARKRAVFDDEDDGIDDDEEEEPLFPAGGPTSRKKDALETLKKTRRRRRREGSEDNGPTEEQLKARAAARRERELEKQRKIKSELFVHDSDDETDEERDRIFFEQEEKLRQQSKINIMKELLNVGKEKEKEKQKQKQIRKRLSSAISTDSDDEVTGASIRSSPAARDNVLAESDDKETDTPMSSPHQKSLQPKRRKLSSGGGSASPEPSLAEKDQAGKAMSDDEDEEVMPVVRPVRQRTRAGFIVDSSDEE